MLIGLEPNYNMLQKHTVTATKKPPEGDLHANELASYRLSVQRLFLRRARNATPATASSTTTATYGSTEAPV